MIWTNRSHVGLGSFGNVSPLQILLWGKDQVIVFVWLTVEQSVRVAPLL